MVSGNIRLNRNGLRWRDALAAHGLPETLCNKWPHQSRLGVFARSPTELAAEGQEVEMIDDPFSDPSHGAQPAK